jgi:hypothetical protein
VRTATGPAGTTWMWSIAPDGQDGEGPVLGYGPTREGRHGYVREGLAPGMTDLCSSLRAAVSGPLRRQR